MISKLDFLKIKAVEILTDQIESKIVNLGEIIPNEELLTFSGNKVKVFDLLKENNIILSFMRGSW